MPENPLCKLLSQNHPVLPKLNSEVQHNKYNGYHRPICQRKRKNAQLEKIEEIDISHKSKEIVTPSNHKCLKEEARNLSLNKENIFIRREQLQKKQFMKMMYYYKLKLDQEMSLIPITSARG